MELHDYQKKMIDDIKYEDGKVALQMDQKQKHLSGYDSEDNAYYVADYPFGRKIRCVIRYWVETKNGKQRFCRQTTHRSFNYEYNQMLDCTENQQYVHNKYKDVAHSKNIIWNKPKKSIYYQKVELYLDENNHVQFAVLNPYANLVETDAFLRKFNL